MPKKTVCLMLLLLFLVGCDRKTVSEESATEADIYVQTDSTLDLCIYNTDTLNPLVTSVQHNAEVLSCLYDSLFCAKTDFTAEPDLCVASRFSEDGKKAFLRLKEGVYFEDNTLLTANDVVLSFRRAKASGGYYGKRLEMVEDIVSDGRLLAVTFSEPAQNSLILLDFPVLPEGGTAEEKDSALLTPPVPGSGSFQLSEYQVNKALELLPNPEHHAGKVPAFSRIVIHLADCRATALSMLESGNVDVLSAENEPLPDGCKRLSYPGCRYVFLQSASTKTLSQLRSMLLQGDFVPEDGYASSVAIHPLCKSSTPSFTEEEPPPSDETTDFTEQTENKITDSVPHTLLYCENYPLHRQTAEAVAELFSKADIFTRPIGVQEAEYSKRSVQNAFDFILCETVLLPDFSQAPPSESSIGLYFSSEYLWHDGGLRSLKVDTLNPYRSAYRWIPQEEPK